MRKKRPEPKSVAVDAGFSDDSYLNRFEIGYDVDNTVHQYSHICHTYPTGALCGTKLLWFHGGPLGVANFKRVDCKTCLHLWDRRGLSFQSGETPNVQKFDSPRLPLSYTEEAGSVLRGLHQDELEKVALALMKAYERGAAGTAADEEIKRLRYAMERIRDLTDGDSATGRIADEALQA